MWVAIGHPGDTAHLVGVDPGTTKLGVCAIEFDVETFDVVSINAFTLNAQKLPSDEWMGAIYGERLQRVRALRDYLTHYFVKLEPFAVGCESPFYNRNRPNAFAALVEVICAVRDAYIEYSCRSPLYLIDPPTVKKAIGASGNADKDSVKIKILNHPILSKKSKTPITELDEHSLDAMAVAWGLLCDLKAGQMSLKTQL